MTVRARCDRVEQAYGSSQERAVQQQTVRSLELSRQYRDIALLCQAMESKLKFEEQHAIRAMDLEEEVVTLIKKDPSLEGLKRIGSGMHGEVYQKEILGRQYALKKVPIDQVNLDALKREISISEKLSPCSNIVRSIKSFQCSGNIYFLMRYVHGKPLSDRSIQSHFQISGTDGKASQEKFVQLRTLASSLLRSLALVHSQGVIHRDIKGGNIILSGEGKPMILDWGVARSTQSACGGYEKPLRTVAISRQSSEAEYASYFHPRSLHRVSTVIGSPAFLAPEMINGEEYDYKVDIWSLGVTLYKLMTGDYPFKGTSQLGYFFAASTQDPVFPEKMPKEWQSLLSQMLQKNPKDRPGAAELLMHPCIKGRLIPLTHPHTTLP